MKIKSGICKNGWRSLGGGWITHQTTFIAPRFRLFAQPYIVLSLTSIDHAVLGANKFVISKQAKLPQVLRGTPTPHTTLVV